MTEKVVLGTDFKGAKQLLKGKVRDVYDLGDRVLIVASDRISAYDSVLPTGIPYKGKVLNLLSAYWFGRTKDIVRNHMISVEVKDFPSEFRRHAAVLEGRSMLAQKAKRLDVECVVRGYISGSAWEEYRKTGSVCGIKLPSGLVESEKLQEPIFTPAIKAASGHDQNVSAEEVEELIGEDLTGELWDASVRLYSAACRRAEECGIIIADTKFEFGLLGGEVILIDEALTPDSSRFWSKADYSPGGPQKSFDKQFVRDYLTGIKWNREPPAPPLPPEIVEKTAEKYLEAYERLTGKRLS